MPTASERRKRESCAASRTSAGQPKRSDIRSSSRLSVRRSSTSRNSRPSVSASEPIRTYPILRGVRGEPARDVTALQDAILRLGALVSDFDSIQEMDLNPVLVLEEGRGYCAVDARIILAQPSS